MSESLRNGSTLTFGYEESPQPAVTHLWQHWLLATTAGELLGLTIPAGMNAIATFVSPFSLALTILSGAVAAACVALVQSLVLRRFLSAFPQASWVGFTAIAAAVTWALGLVPGQLRGLVLMNPLLLTLLDLLLAIAMVFAIGFAQWIVLRRFFRRAIWWIPATAFATTLGAMIPVVGDLLVSEQSAGLWRLFVAIGAGLGMGAIAGAITGAVLVWLEKQRV
jgi:hypothetical protein